MVNKLFKTSRVISFTALMMLVLVGVACGSAAAPETTAPDTSASAPSAAAPSGAVPTAVAQPAAPSGAMDDVKVSPETVTVMIGSIGNERFDYAFSRGTGHDMARTLHAYLISSADKDGSRRFTPGIATE